MIDLVIRGVVAVGVGVLVIWLTERMAAGEKSGREQDDTIDSAHAGDGEPRV